MIYWRSQVLTYKNIRSIMGGKSSLGDWLWRYCMEKDELKQEIIEMVEKIKRTDALLYLYAYIKRFVEDLP